MIAELLQKAILIFIGILFLASAATIFFRRHHVNNSEFRQILKTAEYINVWLILLCFIVTMFFGIINHFKQKNSAYAVISLNYSEASQALNSNGTRYNMAEIISDEVIEMAIEKGAFENVKVKDLADCLSVSPCVQGNVGDEKEYLISTEFMVEYHASKDTAHLNAENVIQMISVAYKEYYIEKYTDNFGMHQKKPDFRKMEPMDIVQFLDKEAMAVLNFLYGMAEKNPSFVTQNQATFNSIAGKVYQFKQTQIEENLKSFILQNGIARDKEQYVDRLQYHIKNVDIDRQKNEASYTLCNEAVEMYAEEMTRVVLVPTWDQGGKYYMGRTKVGVDELSVMAVTFSDYASSNVKEIMENQLVIDKITAAESGSELLASVDSLVDSIYEDIQAFKKEAITASREYSRYKMNQCIAVSIYGSSLFAEVKSMAVFAVFAYATFVLMRIAKRFPRKA